GAAVPCGAGCALRPVRASCAGSCGGVLRGVLWGVLRGAGCADGLSGGVLEHARKTDEKGAGTGCACPDPLQTDLRCVGLLLEPGRIVGSAVDFTVMISVCCIQLCL